VHKSTRWRGFGRRQQCGMKGGGSARQRERRFSPRTAHTATHPLSPFTYFTDTQKVPGLKRESMLMLAQAQQAARGYVRCLLLFVVRLPAQTPVLPEDGAHRIPRSNAFQEPGRAPTCRQLAGSAILGSSIYKIVLQIIASYQRTPEKLLPFGKAGPLCLPPRGALSQAQSLILQEDWAGPGQAIPKCNREEMQPFSQNPNATGREKGQIFTPSTFQCC